MLPRLSSIDDDEGLLKELDKRWRNHQVMVRWMQRFFQYLDRFYVDMEAIANLSDQGFIQFRTIVFERIMPQVN